MTFIASFAVYWGLDFMYAKFIAIPMFGGPEASREEFSVWVRLIVRIVNWVLFIYLWNQFVK